MTKGLRAVAIAVCALAVLVPAAQGARTLHEPVWVPNGLVHDSFRIGNRLLIAGEFTAIGKRTGPAAVFDDEGGLVPDLNGVFSQGTVEAFAPDGSGGWFVGGSFRMAGGNPSSGLAHLRADGTIDPDFAPVLRKIEGRVYQPDVRAMAVANGRVYIGGTFNRIDGVVRNSLAAFDIATGDLTTWDPAPDDEAIEVLVADGSTVYAGGWFSEIGGATRSGVAALDGTTGAATSWNPTAGGGVYAILVRDGSVYLGGEFGQVGGENRLYLAEVSQTTGAVTSWQPQVPGAVRALAADAGSVYAGIETDEYSQTPEPALRSLARSNGSQQWELDARKGSGVAGLVLDGATLYVGGGFDQLGTAARSGLASVTAATGVVTSWAPKPNLIQDRNAYPQPGIRALALVPDGLMAGGPFTSVGGVARRGLAMVNAETWRPKGWWNPRVEGAVYGVARSKNGRTYIVGDFDRVGGKARRSAAAFGPGFGLLPWNPPRLNAGPADHVDVLDAMVILTGSFNSVGRHGQGHGSLAAFDPVTAELLDWGEPNVAGTGFTLLGARGDRVYALFHGEPSTVTILDRATGLIEKRLFSHRGDIYAGAWSGRKLFVGGAFTRAGSKKRVRLAAVDIPSGHVLNWQQTANESVFSLARIGNVLYAGGQFDKVGGESRFGLAAIDARTGALLPWNPAPLGFQGRIENGLVTGTIFTYRGTEVPLIAVLR